MNFQDKNVILFDLDGTLIDSQEGIFNGLRHAMERIGMEVPEETVLRKFIGPSIGMTLMELFGFSKEKADEAVKYYREFYRETGLFQCSLYPGIRELVQALVKQGRKVGLATKKPEEFAVKILENLEMTPYFSTICGATMNDRSNGKGEIITRALSALSVTEKYRAVLIGDTFYDCDGAEEAGIDCIGVLYGFGDGFTMREHGAAAIASDASELSRLLCG